MSIRVVVVDDSTLMRTLISAVINAEKDMVVVGQAADPFEAREVIKATNPDVLTLDIEMPRMDGLTFLSNLMRLRPMPVIMVSTLTQRGAHATLQALATGAADFIAKPTDPNADWQYVGEELTMKIRAAVGARLFDASARNRPTEAISYHGDSTRLLALGASTGGTEALMTVLGTLPKNAPPVVLAQHIPPVFSTSFAKRLNRFCQIEVMEATDGMDVQAGHAYLAPGDFHLQIVGKAGAWKTRVTQSERVNRHRPSVDVLFDSLVPWARQVRVALLTGMGADGAKGLLNLRNAGSYTIAQDQATSVVWGMPGAAVELGAVMEEQPLDKVAAALLRSA